MRIGLFVTCLVDSMRPGIGFAAIELLEAAGCEVVVPEQQTCCGQPGYNSGDSKMARALALKFLAEFESFDYIVLPSGSCAGMIRVHYPELFKDDPEQLARFIALGTRTFELTDFLHRIAKPEKMPGTFKGRLTYHDSCSGLRELNVYEQPRALLAGMPGGRELLYPEESHSRGNEGLCARFAGAPPIYRNQRRGTSLGAGAERRCGRAQVAETPHPPSDEPRRKGFSLELHPLRRVHEGMSE